MAPRKISSLRRARGAGGFTLIELLIVGALIALFAGLAIFGAQQAFLDNQRKAMIGEARQVATALDMAYADVGFLPALCYLDKGLTNLFLTASQSGGFNAGAPVGGGPGENVLERMHIYLAPTVGRAQLIRRDWSSGGYFAPNQSRSGASQGRSGTRPVRLEAGGLLGTYEWPLDAYGNPWMVYDLNVDRDTNIVSLNLNPTGAFETGNYVTAVVSYGRNRVPGGGLLTEDPIPGTGLRLFDGNINNTDIDLVYDRARLAANTSLAGVWSSDRANAPGPGAGPTNIQVDIDSGDPIGITDPGSDDIVFTF